MKLISETWLKFLAAKNDPYEKNIRKSDDPKYKEVASEYSINQVFRQELEKQE